jgi:anti-anti-sigma factor
MEITIREFGDLGTRVVLVGKLDIVGAGKVELPLATVAGSRNHIVVDMTGVDFIASIGIRHLVLASKTVARGARKLLLLDPNPLVTEVLVTTGLQDLLPIVRSEDEARAALQPARLIVDIDRGGSGRDADLRDQFRRGDRDRPLGRAGRSSMGPERTYRFRGTALHRGAGGQCARARDRKIRGRSHRCNAAPLW